MSVGLILTVALKDITGITVIKTSSSVFVLHVNNQFDFLMESIRRTELLIFIITMMDKEGIQRPKLV